MGGASDDPDMQDDDVDTIREAFKIFDRDKDGFISTRELKKVWILYTAICLQCFLYTVSSPFSHYTQLVLFYF